MIDDKYNFTQQVIYEKIKNLIAIQTPPKEVAMECLKTCRLELRIPDVPKDMLLEFYRSLAEQAWFVMYGNFEYDPITKPRSKEWTSNK